MPLRRGRATELLTCSQLQPWREAVWRTQVSDFLEVSRPSSINWRIASLSDPIRFSKRKSAIR